MPPQGGEKQDLRNLLNNTKAEVIAETASLSTRGEVRTVQNTDHYIHLDQPDQVIAVILEVVRSVSRR